MKVRISGKPGMYQVTDVETGKAVFGVKSVDLHVGVDSNSATLKVVSSEQPKYSIDVYDYITAEVDSVDFEMEAKAKSVPWADKVQLVPPERYDASVGAFVKTDDARDGATSLTMDFKQGEPIKFKMETYTSKAFSNWWDTANSDLEKFRKEYQDHIDKMFADMVKRTDQWILSQLTKSDAPTFNDPTINWGAIPSLEEFTNARLGEPYTAKKSEEDKTLEDSIDKMVDTIQKDEKRRTLTATGWHDQLARLCDQLSKGAVVFVHSEDQKNAAQEVAKRLRRKDLVFIIPEDEPKSEVENI